MNTQPKVRLYVAISLDGFIARETGAVDWLDDYNDADDSAYGYKTFYETVDVIVMGRKTYQTILGFEGDWPYPDRQTFVLSHQHGLAVPTPHTQQMSGPLPEIVNDLKTRSGKSIWLAGGGQLATGFLNEGLIDEMILFVIPVMLGKGIRLFQGSKADKHFKLITTDSTEDGMVILVYQKEQAE